MERLAGRDRKSTRLNSSHSQISYAVFCLKKNRVVVRALKEAGLTVDDNSLDPVPILRAPFALHYKRLTPSLPFDEKTFQEALEVHRALERMPERERIEEAAPVVREWRGQWTARQDSPAALESGLARWRGEAPQGRLREPRPRRRRASD